MTFADNVETEAQAYRTTVANNAFHDVFSAARYLNRGTGCDIAESSHAGCTEEWRGQAIKALRENSLWRQCCYFATDSSTVIPILNDPNPAEKKPCWQHRSRWNGIASIEMFDPLRGPVDLNESQEYIKTEDREDCAQH
jgi:hypothetical protein